MDLAGITPYIPSTGERDEIGPCTEGQAEFLCQRTETAWGSVDAWLKGSGTITWHFRDERTNAPLDFYQYPNATMYSPSGANPYIKNPSSPITLDMAHEGSFAYVPYVLTGDPYALEEMQFYVVYNTISSPPSARANFNLGNGVRAVAWCLRALGQAATVTPIAVPCWLKPRSFFTQRLEEQRQWFMTKFVTSTNAPHSNLNLLGTTQGSVANGAFAANTWLNIWQEDFLTTVIGWLVCMGHEDWRPILEWKARDVMARTNGTSGWIRAVPTVYQLVLNEPNKPCVATWADAWALNLDVQPDALKYTNPNTLSSAINVTYPSYALGALAMCARAGVDGALECYEWLLRELQATTTSSKYIQRKWAMTVPV
jgi:hypothetical protein